ncbi:helicase-related protein [Rhodothermus profundi]|uniref:SNF2 family N-terminal domain-containing protein n=1 Tax=Rhodothermus profundi TaxID=633813 RepID=A0A1M6UEY7_9BACT|nr:helicase-related protein [Rhodothermus profundi]SHK67739.1 SNF2 family N-terminal domain-containing protein [Rhodothermus profundi]
MGHIKPGDIIQGPHWPESVEVNLVQDLGSYVRIVGRTTTSGYHVDQMLPRADIQNLQIVPVATDFAGAARDIFLRLEALRYRYASLYDPLLAMNISKVDPLPHQIEAVYGYVLNLPRIRFLIADDPGAGKTIMAGLIIKELKLRRLAQRILIVVPGHLKDQWRREMKERFEEHFVVVDRRTMEALFGENVWLRENQIITSMDFAKQDDVLPSLAAAHFDLVIVDEAHKMSAYRYGNRLTRTARYRLGETLSQIATHLLFLTATPHKGDPENFRLFLDLLVPGFFATEDLLQESIRNRDNPLFIRRMKEDLKDFEGKPLFLPRHVRTISFDLGQESPKEKELYNALSRYVQTQYNKALTKDKRRNVAFALVILQRRFASSTYALYRTLQRRKKRLEDLLRMSDPERRKQLERPILFDPEEAEDASEAERWQQEEIWETLTVAENRRELEREIETVKHLLHQAEAIIHSGEEVKLRHFRQALNDLERRFPGEKILVFTESRDTLVYLEQRLRQWGYSVCTIHGGMKLEDRIQAEAVFRNEAQVMVATEAAGEGINLQFCHLMVNYDLPWNPNRLEQRMGRIHRYGQTKEVDIFNLVATDTREGMVLQRLFEKLEEIRQALGSDKVFDVLGEVYYGKNLAQLMLEAAASARSLDEILREIDIQVDEEYIRRVRENLGESLATRYIDYTRIREMADQAREHRLIPEYTEAFFKKGWEAAGGRYRKRRDGFLAVESIPPAIRRVAEEDAFRKRFGSLLNRYPKVAFDREVAFRHPDAEFVSFGHPLFEALLRWVEMSLNDALHRGAVFTDPDGRLDGVLLFYEGEITDGTGRVAGRRLLAFFADRKGGDVRPVNPALLWDLLEGGDTCGRDDVSLEALKELTLPVVLEELERYRTEIARERERQAHIKEKYGLRSLEHFILELDGDLINLYARQEQGEKVDLVIHNKKEQKRRYEQALRELEEEIRRERVLTLSTPRFVAAARVVPAKVAADKMSEDPDVEQVGMAVAMDYERRYSREPEDVSAQNLGFDIRSRDPRTGRKRYIEVKARAGVGPVALTKNEWFKAQRFGDEYYLYVVLNAATKPELYIIQNPAVNLKPEEVVEVRYWVGMEEILRGGREEG